MIRFSPDSLMEALLRPAIMALPKSWVYTEVMAPDLRFLFAALLGMGLLPSLWRRLGTSDPLRHTYLLFGLVALAFVPWLLTGGNGRYFMPFILVVGVLCIALVWNSSLSVSMKYATLVVMLGTQGYVVSINSPWLPFDSIEWTRWRGPEYLELKGDPSVMAEKNVTYVTFTGQTHSFLAPKFPPNSRWVNLISFDGADFNHPDRVFSRAKRILGRATKLKLVVKAQPRASLPDSGGPNALAVGALNKEIGRYSLRIINGQYCSLARTEAVSGGGVLTSDTAEDIERIKALSGFWICPIQYTGMVASAQESKVEFEQGRLAIQKVEIICPRLFPPGQKNFKYQSYGLDRGYSESDSNLMYAIKDKKVYVKFMRAMNPQLVGHADDILKPSYRLDCGHFTSRESLPWSRGL